MERWRQIWRDGIVPELTRDNLLVLRHALASDDPRLMQRGTTMPPPLMCVQGWPVEAACLLAYPGVVAAGGFALDYDADRKPILPFREDAATVAQAEDSFARLCSAADRRVGEAGAVRHLLGFWDDGLRDDVRVEMLTEVNFNLREREGYEQPRSG